MSQYKQFKNKNIVVMGLGLFGGGVGVIQFLVKQGAHVLVTDLKNTTELLPSLRQLENYPVSYKLGGHDESDFINADMVVVNPAVPKGSRFIDIARNNNASLVTEMGIFFELCPAPIIGITGSNGKSTTTILTGKILQQTNITWVGGNIGRSLLAHIDEIQATDLVILELSSFQLEELHHRKKSPHISIVTNISPNHLDRYSDFHEYIHAKKSIIQYQGKEDYAILNYDDPVIRTWENECNSNIVWFSAKQSLTHGVFVKDNSIVFSLYEQLLTIPCVSQIKIPGIHNLQNILAASSAAFLAGAKKNHIVETITSFTGLEHRLEFVRNVNGVSYYNDSKATTPESAIAALSAFHAPVILIAGGYDKESDFEHFAETAIRHCKGIILIGNTAEKIQKLLLSRKNPNNFPEIGRAGTLKEAFHKANSIAVKGDIILLSPACASYDMFINYEERGKQFKGMVCAL